MTVHNVNVYNKLNQAYDLDFGFNHRIDNFLISLQYCSTNIIWKNLMVQEIL